MPSAFVYSHLILDLSDASRHPPLPVTHGRTSRTPRLLAIRSNQPASIIQHACNFRPFPWLPNGREFIGRSVGSGSTPRIQR